MSDDEPQSAPTMLGPAAVPAQPVPAPQLVGAAGSVPVPLGAGADLADGTVVWVRVTRI